MSVEQSPVTVTLEAGADLTGKQFLFATLSSGQVIQNTTAGGPCVGVIYDEPSAQGQACLLAVGGVVKVEAGAAIAAGANVASANDGQAVTATAASTDTSDGGAAADPLIGSNVLGIALNAAAAAGDIISVLLTQSGAVPTTAA